MLRPHLAIAWKGLPRIGAKLLHPFAQHIPMYIQIPGSLRNRHTALEDQSIRVALELAGSLPSLHLMFSGEAKTP